jgi:uncharacterized membrane protein YqjE
MFALLRSSFATLIDIGATRLELAATEYEEERLRLLQLLISTITTLLLLSMTVLLATTFVIVLMWDSHRLLAIGILVMAFALATVASALGWRRRLSQQPAFMAATVAELQRDADALRPHRGAK